MELALAIILMVINPVHAADKPGCGWWEDDTQTQRNDRIAWEAIRVRSSAVTGGLSKNFVKTALLQASDGAATLPPYTYNYSGWFHEVEIGNAQGGHVLQILEPFKLTAIIVEAGVGNQVEVIDGTGQTSRRSISLHDKDIKYVIYEIGTGMCEESTPQGGTLVD